MASKNLHVALLRGINVGGKNKLPMKVLTTLFEQLGCSDVRTYIQSGNVIFGASAALAKKMPVLAEQAIGESMDLSVPVVVRSAREFTCIAERHPLGTSDCDPKKLHVGFLSSKPTKAGLESLDPQRSPTDEYQVVGREIYLHCPNGVARSKLTSQYFDSRLEATVTFRNWKTTQTLLGMLVG